jgi:hypothetical protein
MLLKALFVLLLILIALGAVASQKPDSFKVERSGLVPASPAAVFERIVNFPSWKEWSPWEEYDPNMQHTYGGMQGAIGSNFSWVGDGKAGAGKMTLTAVEPGKSATIQLDFTKPFEAHNQILFTLTPEGDGTRVTWTMSGPSPFISKLFTLFINMDKAVGADFERGLAKLAATTKR